MLSFAARHAAGGVARAFDLIPGLGELAVGAGELEVRVVQAGDLDGDGRPDDAYLKLACADGKLTQAWYKVRGPRDAASGMASGKRQHGPVTFVKEWGAATPQLSAMKVTYDVKMQKSARLSASGDWAPISLANVDGLCAAASDAAKTVTKTSSNIQNN